MTVEVAIIGAGLSGLAAGIRLAHLGRQVTIFERHSVWGGLNSFYKKDGHPFDTGLHAVTNWVPPGAKGPRRPLERVCRQLRLRLDELELTPQTFSRLQIGDARLDFDNGLTLLTEEIAARFPTELDGFLRLVRDLASYPDATAERPFVSGRQRLAAYLSDPLLRELILLPLFFYGGAAEDDLDWDQVQIFFNSIYAEGFARPRRGIRGILDPLLERFSEAGGVLRRRSGVASLEVDQGRVRALHLDSGERVEAEVVFSSAGRVETARLRSDRPPDADRAAIGTIAFSEGILLLDRPPANLGFRPSVLFYADAAPLTWRPPQGALLDCQSGVVCAPSNYAHAEALGEPSLRVTHLASGPLWLELSARSEGAYAEAKRVAGEQALAAIAPYTGDILPHITYQDRFTPRTVVRYTGHLGGAIYGSPKKQKSGRTDLGNLYLIGTDQGLFGIVGAMLSGVTIANRWFLGEGA